MYVAPEIFACSVDETPGYDFAGITIIIINCVNASYLLDSEFEWEIPQFGDYFFA